MILDLAIIVRYHRASSRPVYRETISGVVRGTRYLDVLVPCWLNRSNYWNTYFCEVLSFIALYLLAISGFKFLHVSNTTKRRYRK